MCEVDNFEKIINEDSFLKNIKRMFIMKQIEQLHIKEVVINFDNSTKSFKITINKDDKNIYQKEYKIKRRNKKSKLKDDRHCKKRKINNKFEDNDKHIHSSTHNFINKISVPPEYVLNKNSFNNNSMANGTIDKGIQDKNVLKGNNDHNNNENNRCDNPPYHILNSTNRTLNENKDKYMLERLELNPVIQNLKLNKDTNIYEMDKNIVCKNDILCKKLYKHIIYFIKKYNIKEIKDSECIKLILKDIENVFKKYGF